MKIIPLPILLAVAHATTLDSTAANLAGHKLLVTSVRTGDTEVFIADPNIGDMVNVSRSLPVWGLLRAPCSDAPFGGRALQPGLG